MVRAMTIFYVLMALSSFGTVAMAADESLPPEAVDAACEQLFAQFDPMFPAEDDGKGSMNHAAAYQSTPVAGEAGHEHEGHGVLAGDQEDAAKSSAQHVDAMHPAGISTFGGYTDFPHEGHGTFARGQGPETGTREHMDVMHPNGIPQEGGNVDFPHEGHGAFASGSRRRPNDAASNQTQTDSVRYGSGRVPVGSGPRPLVR